MKDVIKKMLIVVGVLSGLAASAFTVLFIKNKHAEN